MYVFIFKDALFYFIDLYIFILLYHLLKFEETLLRSRRKELLLRKILLERNDLNVSNFRLIRPQICREKIARKTFQEESYLDEQVDRLTDAEWFAPPGLSASTTQTLYPRHFWNVSSSLLVICNSRLSSSSAFVILLRLLSFSPLPKISRTSHSSSWNFFVSGASRNVRWDSLYLEGSLLLQIFRNKSIGLFS